MVAVLPHNSDNPDAKLRQAVFGGWSYAIPQVLRILKLRGSLSMRDSRGSSLDFS